MMNLLDKYRIPNFSPEDGGGSGASPSPPTETSAPSSSGPGSTASESPSTPASPAPPPAAQTSPSHDTGPSGPAGEAFDFSSIFEGSEDTVPLEVQPAAAKPAAKPTEPAASPTTAAPAEAPAVSPPAPAAVPGTPATATPQAEPPLDRYDPGMLARHLASNEAQALDYVAQNVFKLTPQEIEGLETNAQDTIPKLLAKVFVKSQQNVLSQLASMVPVMIQRQSVMMQRNEESKAKFYQRWPGINRGQHDELVTKYAAVYRQMHPNAELAQMIEELGPMVMMMARIPAPAAAAPTGVVANPAAQRAANGGRPPQPSPFVPAGSAGPAATATAPEVSPWEAMFRHED